MRQRLEVSDKEFRKLLSDVRSHPNRVSLPQDPAEAARTVELLAEFAAADNKVSARERGLIRRVGEKLGLPPSRIESILNQASGAELADPSQVEQRTRELYAQRAQWDDAQRRAKLQELAAGIEGEGSGEVELRPGCSWEASREPVEGLGGLYRLVLTLSYTTRGRPATLQVERLVQ